MSRWIIGHYTMCTYSKIIRVYNNRCKSNLSFEMFKLVGLFYLLSNLFSVSLPQPIRGSGELPSRVRGRAPFANAFWRRTLLFAPIWECSEFIKQCFMSYWGQGRGSEAIAPCPNVEPPCPMRRDIHCKRLNLSQHYIGCSGEIF